MIGKIVPSISSGSKRLILSENLCFLAKDGVVLTLPVQDISGIQNELKFNFLFKKGPKQEAKVEKFSVENNIFEMVLVGFDHPLGIGTTSPYSFTIGQTECSLFLYIKSINNNENLDLQLVNMTITIYAEVN